MLEPAQILLIAGYTILVGLLLALLGWVSKDIRTNTDPRTLQAEWCPPGYPGGWGYLGYKPPFPEDRPAGYFNEGDAVWLRQYEKGEWCLGVIEKNDTVSNTVRARCSNKWKRCAIQNHVLIVGRTNDHLWPQFRFPEPVTVGPWR